MHLFHRKWTPESMLASQQSSGGPSRLPFNWSIAVGLLFKKPGISSLTDPLIQSSVNLPKYRPFFGSEYWLFLSLCRLDFIHFPEKAREKIRHWSSSWITIHRFYGSNVSLLSPSVMSQTRLNKNLGFKCNSLLRNLRQIIRKAEFHQFHPHYHHRTTIKHLN